DRNQDGSDQRFHFSLPTEVVLCELCVLCGWKIRILNHIEPSAAKPQPKLGISPAKGAKHVLSDVEGAAKKLNSGLAFLASFRLRSRQAWREQIPVLNSHGSPETLRKV